MYSTSNAVIICDRDSVLILYCSLWMDGPMNGVDPDQVENEAGAMWRGLYKLEKTFSENPNPLKMAQKVKQHLFMTYGMYFEESSNTCIVHVDVHV